MNIINKISTLVLLFTISTLLLANEPNYKISQLLAELPKMGYKIEKHTTTKDRIIELKIFNRIVNLTLPNHKLWKRLHLS